MTVKDLIEKLSEIPEDYEVWGDTQDGGLYFVSLIERQDDDKTVTIG